MLFGLIDQLGDILGQFSFCTTGFQPVFDGMPFRPTKCLSGPEQLGFGAELQAGGIVDARANRSALG